ncbi:hypothetical protein ACJX0J_028061, partial [Zea mays]
MVEDLQTGLSYNGTLFFLLGGLSLLLAAVGTTSFSLLPLLFEPLPYKVTKERWQLFTAPNQYFIS